MARKNRKGTPFCNLDLEKQEERQFKEWLQRKDFSAKRWFRYVIRKQLRLKDVDL